MNRGFVFARIRPTETPEAAAPTGSRWIPRYLRRTSTYRPVRHPDDDGTWRYPLQEAAHEWSQLSAEERERLLNHPRVWRRIV